MQEDLFYYLLKKKLLVIYNTCILIKLNMIFIVIKYLDKFQKACSFSVHQIIMECIRTFVGVEKPVRGEKSNLNKTIYLKALSQHAHKHFTSFSIGHETVTLHDLYVSGLA